MARRRIKQAFDVFHNRLTPSGIAAGKATSHRKSIASRLERDFNLRRMFYSGSANNGTSVARNSDIDFFASIPTDNLKRDSSVSLREIKESLQVRFSNTKIFVDSPAVVLKFGYADWDTAEVIPADYLKMQDGKKLYDIPDGKGGWMESGPSSHTAYVTEQNNRLNRKLKPLIRFVKAWKYFRNAPISSFYLELRVTKLMQTEASIVHEIDLPNVFGKLADCELAAIRDPKGISGYIQPCSSAKKSEAITKVNRAATRSRNARQAEIDGRLETAFDWWDKVFNDNFPSYYY